MKAKLLMLTLLAFVIAVLLAFRFNDTKPTVFQKKDQLKNIIRCGPDWEALETYFEENEIPPIPGAGSYSWKISTQNDSAQFYFNQGINMYYSFHIIESMASFKKAAKFDPDAPMLQWAQALAYGPNINDLGYAASPEALNAISRAADLLTNSTEAERMLIEAMIARYSADSTITRQYLNQQYVDKMKAAYDRFPGHADIAALYADALMLQHPWDLWKNDGTPKPWTPQIRTVLEKLLAKTPNHPGANHYYIHVMEPSPYADRALASADRLGSLTPGLSHTVHMPSHIYLRVGKYGKGIKVNEEAVRSYKASIPLYAPVTGADFLYIIHNLHMQTNNAMLDGRSAYSLQSAMETMNSISKDYLAIPGALGNYIQYIYMTPTLVNIRFGKWNELLNAPEPGSSLVYASVLYHFGLGMAYANLQKTEAAGNELKMMQELMKDSSLAIPLSPFSSSLEGAVVAENILQGTISMKQKNFTEAIVAFSKAVATEENMVYNEPRDWLLNPKHYLGDAYNHARLFVNAERIFRKDLKNNNENAWALRGLSEALNGQSNVIEANRVMARFKKATDKSDIMIKAAVF